MSRITILIADDEPAARVGMSRALKKFDANIVEASDGDAALELIQDIQPDLVFLDLNMPKRDGLGVLTELDLPTAATKPEVIVVTAKDSIETALECVRLGAADYLSKPYEIERVRSIAARVIERVSLKSRVDQLERRLEGNCGFGSIIGLSDAMQELYTRLERAAAVSLPVLIRGETGTGKELVARELHKRSDRADKPFVAVNTAAIPESLIESELFGHSKGAFTGADNDREGVFREADGGTLFLDEIGDMPLNAQTRILRALQEQVVLPVGSSKPVPVDVRVVSATHQDLEEAIGEGLFRQDLLFRIRGIELNIPALRHRREDILLLARHFLASISDVKTKSISADAIECMLRHNWPGNVRELQQGILGASAMCAGSSIEPIDLGLATTREEPVDSFAEFLNLPLTEAKARLVEYFERTAISAALDQNEGNVSAAARQLGIHRQNLQQKIEKLGLR
ncbi:MAG: sigma-54-dependent transcriptional regulator [Planctomycetaceae bacterium]